LARNEKEGRLGVVAGGGIVHPDLAQVGQVLLQGVGYEVVGPILCLIPLGHASSIVLSVTDVTDGAGDRLRSF
jgi:hypothetical protein